MELTYYGQSCFLVNINGANLLFDPFITPNELASHVNINEIPADYILLSHAHSDHVADTEAIANRTGATIIASYEVAMWYEKKGLKYHPMNTGGKWKFDFGTVKCVSAVHSSSLPDGSYGGNPMGFVIKSDDINIYYSGDTALTMDMQLIPAFAEIDLCILPIGDNFTMGCEDAAEAARMVQCKKVVGVHYDTFGFIKIDKQKSVDSFRMKNIELLLPAIGETISI
ncbi:MAG: metal-dependent hydrolase [Chitinophagaceae bacterium]|nr:MAG: metal-dependent hydrolase [Chitinophagaceae bacterium]